MIHEWSVASLMPSQKHLLHHPRLLVETLPDDLLKALLEIALLIW